jgi:myo-inositol 2-dehydrogenase/D-chiro-inositol 1-dehydrogenase
MMIHDLDMARWLLGEEPREVTAMASALVDPAIGEAGDVDSALVTLRTASGSLCMISNSRRAVYGYDQRIEVHGSEGLIEAGNLLESQVAVSGKSGRTTDPVKHFFLERYADAYAREAAHFAEILNTDCEPLATGDDGLKALMLAEAAAEALRTGSTVHLN